VYRIGIAGSYGGCNLGDEAILSGILTEIRGSVDAEVTVFSGDAEDTARRHHVERSVRCTGLSRDEVMDLVEPLDLFILGGGGILFDHWVREHIREPLLAEEVAVPVMAYAVGTGPLRDREAQRSVRECLSRADVVTVRDAQSRRALEKIDVDREILVTADPALLLRHEPLPEGALESEGLADKGCVIGMSVREPGPAAPDIDEASYHAMLANAADYMVERYAAHVAFVPIEPSVRDLQHAHAVIARMHRPQHASVMREVYTSQQLISLIGRFDLAVGMRLHFLIFAALAGVPFVALPYASKVTGFIQEIGMESPPMSDLTIGQLLALIDRSWDRRRDLRKIIERELPAVQERARENWRLARALLAARPDARSSAAPSRGGA
jgi:polysaccharide pyruvyl transferase CsaB